VRAEHESLLREQARQMAPACLQPLWIDQHRRRNVSCLRSAEVHAVCLFVCDFGPGGTHPAGRGQVAESNPSAPLRLRTCTHARSAWRARAHTVGRLCGSPSRRPAWSHCSYSGAEVGAAQ
jgi:hypothetical protein